MTVPTPYYEADGITLYHGDCREILPTLPNVPDLLLADPPYGIESVKRDGKMGGSVAAPNRVYIPVHDDDKPLELAWLVSIPADRRIIWGVDHALDSVPNGGRLLVWDKRCGTKSNDFADAEVAWDSAAGPCRIFRHRQMGMITDGYGDVERCHPNQKPLALMTWCLSLAPHAAVVVVPYAGSGTELVAAKRMGRRAIGIEIEQKYVEMCIKRLRQTELFSPPAEVKERKPQAQLGVFDGVAGLADGKKVG